VPRATSQEWSLIDRDEDGQLTKEEMARSSARLLSLDADDDRILTPAEMATLREQLQAASGRRMYVGADASHYAAIHLEPDLDSERLSYLLSDLYAPQQDLGPNSFSALSVAYGKLDANGDGWFDEDELRSIRTIDPHVRLKVAFEDPSEKRPGTATIEVETLTTEVSVAAQPTADRAVLSIGGSRLILSAHALTPPADAEANNMPTRATDQIRLMVHDQVDALFEELDANADGRLGEREIEYCTQRLSERDQNGDGQLSGDEFPYSMIVAFLVGESASERSFYVPPSAALPAAKGDKPLLPWFARADLNGDGDVSRREFLGSIEQFDQLDADKDGYIAAREAGR
jgi:Ca2+-binding EF-hand superfamily protein